MKLWHPAAVGECFPLKLLCWFNVNKVFLNSSWGNVRLFYAFMVRLLLLNMTKYFLFDTHNLPSISECFLFVITCIIWSNKTIWRLQRMNFHLHWCGTLHAGSTIMKPLWLWPRMIKYPNEIWTCCITTLSNIAAGKWPLSDMEPLTNIFIFTFIQSGYSSTSQHLPPITRKTEYVSQE